MRFTKKITMAIIAFMVVSMLGSLAYTKWYEYSPAGSAKVEREAREWATSLGYQVVGVAARNDDSDGDGYVSVTVNVSRNNVEQRMAIECKKAAVIMLSWGCRETSLKLDQMRGGGR